MNVAAPVPVHRRLETLSIENGLARLLPATHYARLQAWRLPEPYVLAASDAATELIGLDPAEFTRPGFAEHFCGNRPSDGTDPLAAAYSGQPFGPWAGHFEDGRPHLLGEVAGWELQLTGAGHTPYSRMGDGRTALRPAIREFLCCEAMAGLGVPTTRALCLVGSRQPVQREAMETAVVTRLAPSFIRFGSFEHWATAGQSAQLRQLADYVIARYRPVLMAAANPYEALLRDVARRTGELLAHWQAVGFMHGAMNADNMSILGLTLDYGPCGFMEAFDPGHVCNPSDPQGRYTYRHQPRVAHRNLYALGSALLPLVGAPDAAQAAIDGPYVEAYQRGFLRHMTAKLGCAEVQAGDEDLVAALLALLQKHRTDYHLFFRRLGKLPARVTKAGRRTAVDAPLRELFADREALDTWLAAWRARLAREGRPDAERQAAMEAVNPKYVLRAWVAEQVVRRAQAGDFDELRRVLRCLARPFDEQPECESYAAPLPDWAGPLVAGAPAEAH